MKKKYFRVILIELIVIIGVFLYLFNNKNYKETMEQNNLRIFSTESLEDNNIDKSKLYRDIENTLLNGDKQVIIRDLNIFKDSQEIFNIIEEISNKNPVVMYYKGAEYQIGNLKLHYSKPKEDILFHRNEIEKKRDIFLSNNISSNMSDFEKVLVIHDFIVNNAKYDERLFSEGTVPPESYSAYGVLSLGVGVCESYAKAMKYLLDGTNIESTIVIGESNGENHAWNLVKIDDEYYHIDSTWNDPITNNGLDVIRYNFFNLTDEEISKTHTWNNEDYPKANGNKYNYYRYYKLIVDNKIELENKIRETILKKDTEISLKIEGMMVEDLPLSEIIENIAYKNYEIVKLKSFSYSIDELHDIINFEFFYNE